MTVEEHSVLGGFGSAVCEAMAEHGVRVKRLGLPDRFAPVGSRDDIFGASRLTADAVAAAALELVGLRAAA